MFLLGKFWFREEIVIWARKKTGEPVIRISSVAEAEEFLKKHHIFVVGLFEKFEVGARLLFVKIFLECYTRNTVNLILNLGLEWGLCLDCIFVWTVFIFLGLCVCSEIIQGPDYEEFVKAAAADNAIQFVGVSNIEVAKVLFPNVKPTNLFLGIVKSEPERYTSYGELVNE